MIPRLMLAGLVAASEQAVSAGMRMADIRPEQLAPMVGKVLKLRVTDLDLDVWIICGDERWWLATESQEAADVELSGTLGNLVETARSLTQPNAPLIFEELDIRGSVGVLQTMQKRFRQWIWIGICHHESAWPRNCRHADPNPAYCSFTVDNKPRLDEAPDSRILAVEQKAIVTDYTFSETRARITSLNRQIDRMECDESTRGRQ